LLLGLAMVRVNVLAHFFHGFIGGLLSISYPVIAIFLFIQFLAYEYFEESKVKDEMYHELREWSAGYVTGLGAIMSLSFLGFLAL
jgi:hypothetical protein